MLTQLSTVKSRLNILDSSDDATLTRVIGAVSAQFEKVCNRRFGRTANATEEFEADETEIRVACYPIESVICFELKQSEAGGWLSIATPPDHIIRRGSVISLHSRLGHWRQRGRVTYCGGYVLPGDVVQPGQTPLPEDIQQACVEQVAAWYLNRKDVGMLSVTDSANTTIKIAQDSLLPVVKSALKPYARWLV